LERTHRKCVPQIVQTRPARRHRPDASFADQPVEGVSDCEVAQRLATRVSEDRIII
jgi:hypothetical protein